VNRVLRAGFVAAAACLAMLVSAPAALAATPHRAGGPIQPAYTVNNPIQAENYNAQHGTGVRTIPGGQITYVGFISNGDWTQYNDVQFFNPGVTQYMYMSIASPYSGSVQIKLDSLSNAPIATVGVLPHGNWTTFMGYDVPLPASVTGYHTLFLNFVTSGPDFMNIDWLEVHTAW
jgi:hypothetical protein